MRKLIPAIIGLSLIASTSAWSQQRPTNQSADWYMQHPDEMEKAIDWCHAHPDEERQMAPRGDQACTSAYLASGNLTAQRAKRLMQDERRQ